MSKKNTKKGEEKVEKAFSIIEWIFDLIDLISNFLPGKGATLLLIVAGSGGFIGYHYGYGAGFGDGTDSITCDICEVCETCPEPVECPEPIECPPPTDCPRPLENYTCDEINILRNDCFCIPN